MGEIGGLDLQDPRYDEMPGKYGLIATSLGV